MEMALWELPELGEDNPLYRGDSQRPKETGQSHMEIDNAKEGSLACHSERIDKNHKVYLKTE